MPLSGCEHTHTPPTAAPSTSRATSWTADCDWRTIDVLASSATHVRRIPLWPDRKEPRMTDTPRETRVLDAVVSLVDSLLDDFDVVELLTELTERCAELLDVEAAGLLLADPLEKLHLLAATSEKARDLELFQLQADEGPCLECYASGQPVSVADLAAASPRWPRFVPAAVGGGFASVHAVPMRAAGIVLGALGLFGTHSGELNRADLL